MKTALATLVPAVINTQYRLTITMTALATLAPAVNNTQYRLRISYYDMTAAVITATFMLILDDLSVIFSKVLNRHCKRVTWYFRASRVPNISDVSSHCL